MDSGNSGSMQSSSGGEDQDHEVSRPESVPVYLNSPVQFGSSSDPNQILHPSLLSHYQNQNQHQPAVFDHLSSNSYNYDHHLHTTLSQVAQPNPSNPNFMLNPTRSNQPNPILNPPSSPSAPQPLLPNSSGHNTAVAPPRSSKKRTRASRRAPTTVLTTDTSNFRAMVQEFTGIPAPPFSATTSSSYSRRLDMFGSGSTRSPLYPLLRPSPQKLHQPTPFLSSSPSSNSNIDSNSNNSSLFMMNNITSNNNFMTSNFEFNQGVFPNMQTPILTFDSPPPLMHSSSSINVGNFGARPTRGLIGNLAMHSSLEDQLGVSMSHHGSSSSSSYVNTNQPLLGGGGGDGGSIDNNHAAASVALRSDHDHHDVWRDRGVGSSDGRSSSVLDQMRPNIIANSTTRGEGTVNSWISPNSD